MINFESILKLILMRILYLKRTIGVSLMMKVELFKYNNFKNVPYSQSKITLVNIFICKFHNENFEK